MKTSLLLATLSSLALAVGLAAAETAPVAFNGFSYTGRDDVFKTQLPAGHYRNPILAGFYPDPSICRVGDDYYLINSTFAYFPGIPIFHSRDLVNWQQIGHIIDRPTQLNFDNSTVTHGLFAPALSYHNGTFYMVCTAIDGGGNFLVTATNPAGPWSDPIWLHFDGIDPSIFFDDNGRAWMLNNGNPPDNKPLYQGHRAIWIQEFDPATKTLIGPRSIIVNGGVDLAKKPVWIEGPHLYKRDGWYYLCCAEGGTSIQHSQVILRSKAVTGPFLPWDKNPILTQRDLDGTAPHAVTCTGHADLVIGPDGNWWSIFLGCRPYGGEYTTTGRETFLLPVKWTDDGWPVILPPGERVPYIVKSPAGADSVPSPLTGNFTWFQDFKSPPAISPYWIMLRQPHETWWKVDAAAGKLELTPRDKTLAGLGNPSFLGHRVQHAKFDASLSLVPPGATKISAGLALLQNEVHQYFFAVHRTADGLELFLELANGGAPGVIAQTKIADTAHLELRVAGDEGKMAFDYAVKPGEWQSFVPNAATLPVTVQAAGGGLHFTGAVVGPHARLDP